MSPIGTTASTGQKYSESGVWKVAGSPSTTVPIAKSNTCLHMVERRFIIGLIRLIQTR